MSITIIEGYTVLVLCNCIDGFIDKAVVQEAEYKVRDLEQLVSFLYTYKL